MSDCYICLCIVYCKYPSSTIAYICIYSYLISCCKFEVLFVALYHLFAGLSAKKDSLLSIERKVVKCGLPNVDPDELISDDSTVYVCTYVW